MLKSYRLCTSSGQKAQDHIVHSDDCSEREKAEDVEFIGLCTSATAAISEAKRRGYQQVKPCKLCSHRWDPSLR